MATPLMPKATAIWLIENTTLTFEQIAEFCGLHLLEAKAIADGDVAKGIKGIDPINMGQLSREEIKRCEKNPTNKLTLLESMASTIMHEQQKKRKGKYTPVAKRQDKPDAIVWLLKHCPELTDNQIVKLIGTTKNTIMSVRDKTHWNSNNLKAKDPVLLGLCSQTELNQTYEIAKKKQKTIESLKEIV